MLYELKDIVRYSNQKINTNNLNLSTYISTENMIQNFGGIKLASSVPFNASVTKFCKGDILLSNIRPYFKKLYYSKIDGGSSNDVLCFKIINTQQICPLYLFYAMSTDKFINYVVSTSKGTKMPRGDKMAILKYSLNIDSYDKQLRIVDIIEY